MYLSTCVYIMTGVVGGGGGVDTRAVLDGCFPFMQMRLTSTPADSSVSRGSRRVQLARREDLTHQSAHVSMFGCVYNRMHLPRWVGVHGGGDVQTNRHCRMFAVQTNGLLVI
mmetsp:Transcript_9147/g.26353  ORF Transcript_9147/g.26353 Transcript_9147/m.26353 type:complete len:112 (+) Transcript_9147:675-1010(+)